MIDFAGKSVLVTGAAGGLGRAVALGFAGGGARLTLLDVDAARLDEVVGEVVAAGAQAHASVSDICDRQACHDAVEGAVARYGRLDVLCNIAAILRFHKVSDVTEADWRRILDVNVTGAFFLSQAAIPHLLKSNGNIVNAVSPAATLGHAFIVPYSVSKGALLQMTRSMAMEFIKQPIRINAVMPGPMNTEISKSSPFPEGVDLELVQRYSGIRAISEPVDVAQLVLFVASDLARAVHGACLAADQGVTAG